MIYSTLQLVRDLGTVTQPRNLRLIFDVLCAAPGYDERMPDLLAAIGRALADMEREEEESC